MNGAGNSAVIPLAYHILLSHSLNSPTGMKSAQFAPHPIAGQVCLGYNLEV
jgi:hypothetical protein